MTKTAYGSWPSPLSARDVYANAVMRHAPQVDGGAVYWLESRPEDEGRVTLVGYLDGVPRDVSLPGQDVRTRFHEYGGGEVGVADGLVLYCDFAEQRVWRASREEGPYPITPPSDGRVRFSCFRIDTVRGVAFCLREDQRRAGAEAVTSLVRLSLDGPNDDFGTEVVRGRVRATGPEASAGSEDGPDFVLDPALSPDGAQIAWLEWEHPNMAWDGCRLVVGRLDPAGDLLDARVLAGGETEAVEQPRWLGDDQLTFLTDESGWSNHVVLGLSDAGSVPVPVRTEARDYGQPRWTPDQSSYDLLPGSRLVTARSVDGVGMLCVVDLGSGELTPVPSDLTYVMDVRTVDADTVVCRAFFADRPAELVTVDLASGRTRPVVTADPTLVCAERGSAPEPVDWTSTDGATAHGFLYRPANQEMHPPEGELPPLIVTLHGGPTSAALPAFSLARTFWTSRGFAVLDVNYGGSTGFGRAYRVRLRGRWGVVDVKDAASGARQLVDAGVVDGARVAITGGSAGGYTALAALAFTDVFGAGASHFGIGDLAILARDTHKLESRYLWGLVAPWPEGRDVYAERSPLQHLDQIDAPLILLQGTDDRVVPPAQAETMAEALRARRRPVAVQFFEGEGHGFRNPQNRARALECELSFYAQVFGLEPADDLDPVLVENLSRT